VLTLWRNKLRMSDRPQRIFDAVREVVNAANVLAGKTRRALDSMVLDDAVTRQDAIMQLVAQIRRVRRVVPEAKALTLSAHDYDNDAGKPVCAWNDRVDIDRVVTELVNDARTILSALDGVELDDVQAEAVGLLALVAGQDVEPGDSDGTWRIAQVTRPDRMVSVHDPESRHVHKTTSNYRDGFKAHIRIEPDTGLITACDLTAGNVGDAQADCLARPQRQPQSPLPRHHPQPDRPRSPLRRDQPAPPRQPRRHLGPDMDSHRMIRPIRR
jgi:hypothetical protein